MAKELKRRGLRFVGPTTAYALMQATGMVDDHVSTCFRAQRPGFGNHGRDLGE
jgi:DNA-3-methyladenine glycosylase I